MPSGHLIEILDAATDKRSSYRVDAAGRRISERAVQAGALYQNNRLVYDALGQLTQVTDTSAGRVQISIAYDAAGNRQRIVTDISADGSGTTPYHSEGWYAYDAMNRQIVVNAVDAAGNLGEQGHRLAYDLNGNRISDTWYGTRLKPPTNTGVAKNSLFGDLVENMRHAPGYTTATYAYDEWQQRAVTHQTKNRPGLPSRFFTNPLQRRTDQKLTRTPPVTPTSFLPLRTSPFKP